MLMHAVHFFVRVSQVRATSDTNLGWEDLYWERSQQSWFDWTVPTTCALLIVSTLSALHLFSQTRTYQLHRRSRADPVNSAHTTFVPSPERDVRVHSEVPVPKSTFARRIVGLLHYILLVLWRVVVSVVRFLLGFSWASPSTSSPPQGAPAEVIQQLEMWVPGELERTLLGVYSPVHALLWMCTGSTNWVLMCVVMCAVGLQTGTLIEAYEGLVKDKAILAAEVMHEYNEGFVYPKMNPSCRLVGLFPWYNDESVPSAVLPHSVASAVVPGRSVKYLDRSTAPCGLNVVHPVQQDHDLASPFPDFSAHLDLWTNLAFESDEPLALSKRKPVDDDDDDDSPSPPGLPSQDSHENAVVPPAAPPNAPPFDINALLAGVGIDPFLTPTPPPAPAQHSAPQQVHHVPSLAQLLALHAAHSSAFPVPLPSAATTATSPTVPTTPSPPPAKRARAPKLSSSTDSNSDPYQESTQSDPTATTPVATEDKRRRNTAASARFRLKKKEREAALERRAKELEDRVVELERECEGLRRENGWLKGLVVGVTGAGAAQHQHAPSR
ncbi:hypothetical protein JVT61DRAFT_2129 [Boletus reticuloceps]|uniref:BZIP domain-containing protein n=1 Tax=Boletus reticuloceps TaxID=495285 RepID=A0A8I2YQC7_9AGAM|nr:hypothetical protein JVT61DRAFT_2129 [Boletus reticuloceps]